MEFLTKTEQQLIQLFWETFWVNLFRFDKHKYGQTIGCDAQHSSDASVDTQAEN